MKKIILKLLLLVGIVWLISLVIRQPIGYFWPNRYLTKKDIRLNKKANDYNTVFIGTSRVFRGINPIIWDRNLKEHDIHSFNFGIPGFTFGENFGLLSEFSKKTARKDHIKYVIVELRSFYSSMHKRSLDKNLHTHRSKYWVDWAGYSFILANIWQTNNYKYSLFEKLNLATKFSYSFLEYQFNIGSINRFIAYFDSKNKPLTKNKFHRVGYLPLEKEKKPSVKMRQKKFLTKAKEHMQDKIMATKVEFSEVSWHNKVYTQKLLDFIQLYDKQGAKLIFVLPPHLSKGTYTELIPIYKHLPKGHKINMSSSSDYPQFYDPQYMFDKSHFSQKGAAMYTRLLAQEFEKLLPQKKPTKPKVTNTDKSKSKEKKAKKSKMWNRKMWKKLKERQRKKKKNE